MRKYYTFDTLPGLDTGEMIGAETLTLIPAEPSVVVLGIENSVIAYGNESNTTHLLYKFTAYEGRTYQIFSSSHLDPTLVIYDQNGKAIEVNSEHNDDEDYNMLGTFYAQDYISYWVSPYTGTYYVEPGWRQGTIQPDETFYSLTIYEDVDTANSEWYSAKVDRIFNWGEQKFPSLLPDHPESESIFDYHARIYSNDDALGEKDGDIYFYDGGADGTNSIVKVGTVSDFLPQALADGF